MALGDDYSRKSIIVDLATITNPSRLVEALIVFQKTHDRICVNSKLMEVDFDWPNNTVGEIDYDLRDPEAITFLRTDFDVSDLSFQSKNLPLALRLFQHAIKKGLIDVVEEPALAQSDDRVAGLCQALDFESIWAFQYSDKDRGYFWRMESRAGWVFENNLSLALRHGMQLAVSDIRAKASASGGTDMFVKVEEQTIGQVVSRWQPASFDEILAAIDHPGLLPSLTEAVKDVVDDHAYSSDVKFFVPRLILDTVTAGQFSNFEMLYKIYRHNRDRRKND